MEFLKNCFLFFSRKKKDNYKGNKNARALGVKPRRAQRCILDEHLSNRKKLDKCGCKASFLVFRFLISLSGSRFSSRLSTFFFFSSLLQAARASLLLLRCCCCEISASSAVSAGLQAPIPGDRGRREAPAAAELFAPLPPSLLLRPPTFPPFAPFRCC